jgi:hypothetical protein
VLLGVYPFFTENPLLLIVIGVALMVAPFYIDF